jgi:hypothetical protein
LDPKYTDDSYAWLTCALALQGVATGNFGVGAILVDDGGNQILAQGHNEIFNPRFRSDRHAEMVVMDCCRTQIALIKSRSLLRDVLKRQPVAALELISRQKDPLAWVEENLRVEPFGGPQLIRVSLSGEDHKSLAVVVDAVMEKYLEGIREDEYKRVQDLDRALSNLNQQLAHKLQVYFDRTRGERFIEGQCTRDAFSACDKELRRIRFELFSVKSRIATVSADKNIDAEAEKNLKQLREQSRVLEDQASQHTHLSLRLIESGRKRPSKDDYRRWRF